MLLTCIKLGIVNTAAADMFDTLPNNEINHESIKLRHFKSRFGDQVHLRRAILQVCSSSTYFCQHGAFSPQLSWLSIAFSHTHTTIDLLKKSV